MERIGDEVTRELRRFGPEAGIAAVVEAWPGAVGDAVARNAWPARLAPDGTLHVATSSSAWAFELAQLAPTILERLAGTLGADAPRAARFAVGRVPEPPPPAGDSAPAHAPRPGAEERDAARSLAAGISDPELRELVARAAAASLFQAASDRRF
jgi:hypothetical protein